MRKCPETFSTKKNTGVPSGHLQGNLRGKDRALYEAASETLSQECCGGIEKTNGKACFFTTAQ